MELKFEKVFNEIQELIEDYCTDEDKADDLFHRLTEHDFTANCHDEDLLELIKDDKEFSNEIRKLYRLSKGMAKNEK
ncbi:hypothetical protein BEL05_00725 [Shewanella colwelliana]|uniref:Uncharacterized protein n=1 Tax=Shewanella colwelliana TaxID=23 RepID=A0A1E5IUI5_SHECO|nr:hypothetical protein [Shewanella colwelliana]OEG74156.1 hypothetical protein BEL05_00725 [Shewanella colwelliana]